MLSALNRFVFLSNQRVARSESLRRADEMYDLFLDRQGLVLPITDEEHPNNDFVATAESNTLLTESSLRKVQAGQFTSIHDQPFEFRFSVAMRSIVWPVNAFINFLQPYGASQLATAQDSQAMTALHWATKHLGYWAYPRAPRDAYLMIPWPDVMRSLRRSFSRLAPTPTP